MRSADPSERARRVLAQFETPGAVKVVLDAPALIRWMYPGSGEGWDVLDEVMPRCVTTSAVVAEALGLAVAHHYTGTPQQLADDLVAVGLRVEEQLLLRDSTRALELLAAAKAAGGEGCAGRASSRSRCRSTRASSTM
ncbi:MULTISPECIES: hypothetical protein [Kitasatospora]|uniref:PIN domain-containing protein n=1 Tax=Kitasatospora setae (strain ATCC 33774 / DSM 43861 / JCM 3304 / KCC A-0304 / NBRC 14216 / KM-6054) TaxID=452652 RepID=E4N8G5_KITSK|nr:MULTISPECIES: hypothetical protein [Kitasatospora]BAJ27496.1 hypothetical protein KSE_16710 [Kitasatospora setae KM-6054]